MKTADLDYTVEYALNSDRNWEYNLNRAVKVKVRGIRYNKYGRDTYSASGNRHILVEQIGRKVYGTDEPYTFTVLPGQIRETWAQHEERVAKREVALELDRIKREQQRERDAVEIRDAREVTATPAERVHLGQEFELAISMSAYSRNTFGITREEAYLILGALIDVLVEEA